MNRASRITRHDLSNPGRRLLSRRDFLQRAGNGLGGIALAYLLAEHGLLAAENLTPHWLHHPLKVLLALVRSLPIILLALLFVAAI